MSERRTVQRTRAVHGDRCASRFVGNSPPPPIGVPVSPMPNGVHLTPDGARIYGDEIAHQLAEQLGLLASPKPC
jgi:lysophospholipase L1-like esterase